MARLISPLTLASALLLPAAAANAQLTVQPGRSITAALATGERLHYSIPAQQGQEIHVQVRSMDFTPHVVLAGTGAQAEARGQGGVLNMNCRGDGPLTLTICAVEPAGSGHFSLLCEVERPPSRPQITAGQTVVGRLTGSDRCRLTGEYCDRYQMEVTSGETCIITLVSEDFDPFLTLRLPSGASVRDDDSAGHSNARITVQLEQSGICEIEVSSLEPGRQGSYHLTVH